MYLYGMRIVSAYVFFFFLAQTLQVLSTTVKHIFLHTHTHSEQHKGSFVNCDVIFAYEPFDVWYTFVNMRGKN